jgi:large subunit ribosomal protein L15
MQLHDLKPIHKLKKKKRIGRGGKRGAYSGRGQKGQKSRSGKRLKPVIRELIKRYPKLRGYKFKSNSSRARAKIINLNLDILEGKFNAGEKINPKILLQKRLIRRIKGVMPVIKILGKGKITKSLIVENCQVSKSAKKMIEEAGGEIKAKNVKRKT